MNKIILLLGLVFAQNSTKVQPPQIATRISVVGETPIFISGTAYGIAHNPAAIACYENGLRQKLGLDFTIVNSTINSLFWQQTDIIQCDYSY